MLFSGVVDIIIFATAGSSIYGSGWFLVDGILTAVSYTHLDVYKRQILSQGFCNLTKFFHGYLIFTR